ncbi:MAG: DUF1924 domain-containing protein [Mariprofundus sp.]
MLLRFGLLFFTLTFFSSAVMAGESAVSEMLSTYQQQGASNFTADGVETLWNKKVMGPDGKERSCATCHHSNLKLPGMHFKTGKVIEPMAASVNPERYQSAKKIKKWFFRNCKWTWGRECTAQEKGNFLTYLESQ